MELRQKIRQYIIEASAASQDSIQDNTLIFEAGLLDSMGLLFLVQFLQDEFNVSTEDQDLHKNNFESVDTIVAYLERRLEQQNVKANTLY